MKYIIRFYIFLEPVAKCDFDSGLCSQWFQSTSDQFDWTVQSGPTHSSGTGPTADHSSSGKSGSATVFYFRVFFTFFSYELLLLVWQLEKYGLLKGNTNTKCKALPFTLYCIALRANQKRYPLYCEHLSDLYTTFHLSNRSGVSGLHGYRAAGCKLSGEW